MALLPTFPKFDIHQDANAGPRWKKWLQRGRVPYTKFTWHPVHKPYETGLKNSKCFCWKCLYSLTAKIDFSDLYSISGEELIIKEENWWTSYMELFPNFHILSAELIFLITGLLFKDWSYSISLILLVQPPQSFSKIIIFLYYQIQLLLLLLQHFPESSFTALFFLISWIGATSKNFQQNDSFLLLNFSSKDWSYSISPIFMDWPNEVG